VRSLIVFVALAAFGPAQAKRTFTGTITDTMCAAGNHTQMKMGPTDAECTIACVNAHGALFALYDGANSYMLSDQKAPEKFAGKKVTVTGTLNTSTRTIQVDSIAAAK
jgi:hypothetical protein